MAKKSKASKTPRTKPLPKELFAYIEAEDADNPVLLAEETLEETAERDENDQPKLVGRYELVETITVVRQVRATRLPKH